MSEPSINFNQFSAAVDAKLGQIKMPEGKQSYIRTQLGSIFAQGDVNKDNQLSKSEMNSVLGMLNKVVSLAQEVDLDNDKTKAEPKIRDSRFHGLEDYGCALSGAKDGIGEIIVNGEKVIVDLNDESILSLHRTNANNNGFETLEYKSMDELKQALQNPEFQWGRTAGKGFNDVFIP